MKDYYIGPNALKSQYDLRSLDRKIDKYELRLNGWFLKIAKALRNDPSDPEGGSGADPVALMTVISLFEAHGVYLQGKTAPLDSKKDPLSKSNFTHGFQSFLRQKHGKWSNHKQQDIAAMVYTQVRCGLFHLNTAKKGIWYDRGPNEEHPEPSIRPRYYNKKLVKITFNVPTFVIEVEEYFRDYIANLRQSNSQQRKCFAEGWQIINDSISHT